jgi:succinate dehydrogenase/fumarate reductase flavoprotein subunit
MAVVAGAGMAGLVAAARLRQLGQPVRVVEKGSRPGGSMLLSSGVVWRHHSLETFRSECPGGDAELQRLIIERLDDGLDWLESAASPAVERETRNPRTVGRRFEPRALTEALVRAAGDVSLSEPLAELPAEPVVLATGGFAAKLARERGLPLRAAPWSEGDGLRLACERGAALAGDLDEFYGRAMPAPPANLEGAFVRAAQVYGRYAHVVDDAGTEVFTGEPIWSETDLAQAIARQPGGTAWYVVDSTAIPERVGGRYTVGEMISHAVGCGGVVRVRAPTLDALGLGPLGSPKLTQPPFFAVKVVAAVTHTLGGLRIDGDARVLRPDGSAIDGLYSAGVDAGGVATGGYASGLATALVLGLAAAESIAGRPGA